MDVNLALNSSLFGILKNSEGDEISNVSLKIEAGQWAVINLSRVRSKPSGFFDRKELFFEGADSEGSWHQCLIKPGFYEINASSIYVKFLIFNCRKDLDVECYYLSLDGVNRVSPNSHYRILNDDRVEIDRDTISSCIQDLSWKEVRFSVSLSNDFSITSNDDELVVLSDLEVKIEFSVPCENIEVIFDINRKISQFLTLLTGCAIQPYSVLVNGQCPALYHSFYDQNLSVKGVDFPFSQLYMLVDDGGFEKGLRKCFDDEVLNDLWARLAVIFSYESFWEMEILSIVSYVDQLSSFKFKGGYSNTDYFEKLSRMKKALLDEESEGLREVIEYVGKSIKKCRNSPSRVNFKIRYDSMMEVAPSHIAEILNISNEDFAHIKRIRDIIAHGENPGSKMTEGRLDREMVIVWKLKLLLIYFYYDFLGLDESVFLSACDSNNGLQYKAELNSEILNIYSPRSRSYQVEASFIDAYLNRDYYLQTVIFEYGTGHLTVNDDLTSGIKDNFKAGPEDYLKGIEGLSSIEYLGGVCLFDESKTRSVQVFQALFVNSPQQDKNKYSRYVKYDANAKEWGVSDFDKKLKENIQR